MMMKPKELAELLNVHHNSILKWINEGRIKAIKVGFEWRIPKAEVDRIMEEGIPAAV